MAVSVQKVLGVGGKTWPSVYVLQLQPPGSFLRPHWQRKMAAVLVWPCVSIRWLEAQLGTDSDFE
jgi:hypothetical protein